MEYNYCEHCAIGLRNDFIASMACPNCIHDCNEYGSSNEFVLADGYEPPPYTIDVQFMPGTTIFIIDNKKRELDAQIIEGICMSTDKKIIYQSTDFSMFTDEDIGKTVFLNHAEADAALKSMEKREKLNV